MEITLEGACTKIWEIANLETREHVRALERWGIRADPMTTSRILKLNLLNNLGKKAKEVKEIRIIQIGNVKKTISKEEENEIRKFYEEIDPLDYYDFLIEKIGDPYSVEVVWKGARVGVKNE